MSFPRSRRFLSPKNQTPGPGQYDVSAANGHAPAPSFSKSKRFLAADFSTSATPAKPQRPQSSRAKMAQMQQDLVDLVKLFRRKKVPVSRTQVIDDNSEIYLMREKLHVFDRLLQQEIERNFELKQQVVQGDKLEMKMQIMQCGQQAIHRQLLEKEQLLHSETIKLRELQELFSAASHQNNIDFKKIAELEVENSDLRSCLEELRINVGSALEHVGHLEYDLKDSEERLQQERNSARKENDALRSDLQTCQEFCSDKSRLADQLSSDAKSLQQQLELESNRNDDLHREIASLTSGLVSSESQHSQALARADALQSLLDVTRSQYDEAEGLKSMLILEVKSCKQALADEVLISGKLQSQIDLINEAASHAENISSQNIVLDQEVATLKDELDFTSKMNKDLGMRISELEEELECSNRRRGSQDRKLSDTLESFNDVSLKAHELEKLVHMERGRADSFADHVKSLMEGLSADVQLFSDEIRQAALLLDCQDRLSSKREANELTMPITFENSLTVNPVVQALSVQINIACNLLRKGVEHKQCRDTLEGSMKELEAQLQRSIAAKTANQQQYAIASQKLQEEELRLQNQIIALQSEVSQQQRHLQDERARNSELDESLISTRCNLEDREEQICALSAEVEDLKSQNENVSARLRTMLTEHTSSVEDFQRLYHRYLQSASEVSSLKAQFSTCENERDSAALESSQFRDQISCLTSELHDQREISSAFSSQNLNLKEMINSLQENLQEGVRRLGEEQRNLFDLKDQVRSLQQELSLSRQISEQKNRLFEKNSSVVATLERTLRQYHKALATSLDYQEALISKIIARDEQLLSLRRRLSRHDSVTDSLESEIQVLLRTVEDLSLMLQDAATVARTGFSVCSFAVSSAVCQVAEVSMEMDQVSGKCGQLTAQIAKQDSEKSIFMAYFASCDEVCNLLQNQCLDLTADIFALRNENRNMRAQAVQLEWAYAIRQKQYYDVQLLWVFPVTVVSLPVVPRWLRCRLELTKQEALDAEQRASSSEKGLASLVGHRNLAQRIQLHENIRRQNELLWSENRLLKRQLQMLRLKSRNVSMPIDLGLTKRVTS